MIRLIWTSVGPVGQALILILLVVLLNTLVPVILRFIKFQFYALGSCNRP